MNRAEDSDPVACSVTVVLASLPEVCTREDVNVAYRQASREPQPGQVYQSHQDSCVHVYLLLCRCAQVERSCHICGTICNRAIEFILINLTVYIITVSFLLLYNRKSKVTKWLIEII